MALALMISLNSLGQTNSKIKGVLLGYNGEPMPLAHVSLSPANSGFLSDDVIQQVTVNEDGSFEMEIRESGNYTLHLTGVHHKRYTTPITIDGFQDIDITAKLGTLQQRLDRDSYVISASMNNFNIMGGVKANRSGDSEYKLPITTSDLPFKYQVGYGYPIAGISDKYELITSLRYSSDHYVAVVENLEEQSGLVFDVSKFPPGNLEPEVSFGNQMQNKLAQLEQLIREQETEYVRARSNHLMSGRDLSSLSYDWSPVLDQLSREYEAASEKELKDILVVYMLKLGLSGAEVNQEIGEYALTNISPASDAWAIEPAALFVATNLMGGMAQNQSYIDELLATQTSDDVRKEVLFVLVRSMKEQDREEDHAYYYSKLVSEFPESDESLQAKQAFTFKRKIEKGSIVPPFSIPSLEDGQDLLTNAHFEGTYYLIDVWATWCGPCIFEMENLHEAYELYKDDNFDILSISIDEYESYVTDFREQKWPMPWKNAYDKEGFRGETMKLFEVYGIPRALLINPEGEIVAMDAELRGENLNTTLEKFLGDESN